jgi:hypothetical protein
MKAISRLRDNALDAWLQKVYYPSPANGAGETSADLDWLDAFVVAHSTLEFDEFLSRLRQLDAWRALFVSRDTLPSCSPSVSPRESVVRNPFVQEQITAAEKEKNEKRKKTKRSEPRPRAWITKPQGQ